MADVKATDVAALRKQSGAGMMDCKRALEENDGDIEKAKDWLRSQGITKSAKRSGRAADDGAVDVIVENGRAALAELTAETDFVAKGADFTGTVADLTQLVLDEGDDDVPGKSFRGSTVGDVVTDLAAKLGENVGLGRVARFESRDGLLDGYKHVQNERGTVGVLVELGGVDPGDAKAREVAHDLALHIASAAPGWVHRDDVPAETVERERAVFEEQTRAEGKPDQAVPKIVEGRLNGFYKEAVLVDQPFVRDQKTTIGKLVFGLGAEATVRRFVRVKVGEE
ncbi:MAG: translation elongation factor Ts [Acidimicrobiia bacterium]